MRLGPREVGPGHPCCMVAEVSNAHNGDLQRALRLVEAAKEAGADAIKWQAYTPAELIALRGDGKAPDPWGSQGWTMASLYEKARTPLEWFPWLVSKAASLKLPWFASVFGAESLQVLVDHDCPVLKVSHLDCGSTDLAQLVCAANRPILVSVAQQEPSARYFGVDADVTWLDCLPDYPTALEDMHLRRMPELWGLSVHSREPLVGPVAVTLGAHYLEWHFHLEAEPSELEANVSLNEREFAAMVDSVRQAEVMLGR